MQVVSYRNLHPTTQAGRAASVGNESGSVSSPMVAGLEHEQH